MHVNKYAEGDLVAIPTSNGYATGLIARKNRTGAVLLYCFGDPSFECTHERLVKDLKASKAILVGICGDLGIMDGSWKLIGSDKDWARDDWPIPVFGRIDDLDKKAWRIYYDDSLDEESEEPCTISEAGMLPEDCVWGAVALQRRLSALLAEKGN